ncbi:MAG: GxxExxY protein [Bacteroidetes bacterium]|nr:GxxExxY protein [Bacteroidota bacterium]MCL6100645.1 GxxExxY protein [Bacteroidota bacterium]
MNNDELNKVSGIILDSAIEVHKQLGPGLLESVYEVCLFKELKARNLFVERQVPVNVVYKGESLDIDFRIDLLVEHEIIIELKAVEIILPVHEAQILTYLKLAEKRLGLLINFNVPKLVDGFRRKVMNF